MTTLNVDLGSEANEFLSIKKAGTQVVYRAALRWLLTYYQEKYGPDVTLSHFLDRLDENTKQPRRERERLAEIELNGFIEYLSEREKSNKTIRAYFAATQNFLKYKTFTVNGEFIKLPRDLAKKENKKHAWTLEQIREFVSVATNPRDQAIILCMFQSGISVGDLCALNYGDIQDEYEKGVLPLLFEYVRQKTGEEVKTFLGRDAVKYLRRYLDTRKNLRRGDPLFIMKGKRWGERITEKAILHRFNQYVQDLSFIKDHELEGFNPARPHSLRAGFRSRLTGYMTDSLIEFFIGHGLGDAKKTYMNMYEEDLRESYASFEHLLAIEKTSRDEKTVYAGDVDEKLQSYKNEVEVLRGRLEKTENQVKEQEKAIEFLSLSLKDSVALMEKELMPKALLYDLSKAEELLPKVVNELNIKGQEEEIRLVLERGKEMRLILEQKGLEGLTEYLTELRKKRSELAKSHEVTAK
ncbi:MAG: tyrosine-type recombinase/integrase [Candidatus Bathyarchaeota archaeon]|nr:tyrosine-type recombinase/integrase [Candidatus Bathyarchaeota archaeon]